LSDNKTQQQQQRVSSTEIKRKISSNSPPKRSARPHAAIIESTIIQSSIDPGVTNSTTMDIVRNASLK